MVLLRMQWLRSTYFMYHFHIYSKRCHIVCSGRIVCVYVQHHTKRKLITEPKSQAATHLQRSRAFCKYIYIYIHIEHPRACNKRAHAHSLRCNVCAGLVHRIVIVTHLNFIYWVVHKLNLFIWCGSKIFLVRRKCKWLWLHTYSYTTVQHGIETQWTSERAEGNREWPLQQSDIVCASGWNMLVKHQFGV